MLFDVNVSDFDHRNAVFRLCLVQYLAAFGIQLCAYSVQSSRLSSAVGVGCSNVVHRESGATWALPRLFLAFALVISSK